MDYPTEYVKLKSTFLAALPREGNRLLISNSPMGTQEEVRRLALIAADLIGCRVENGVYRPSTLDALWCALSDFRWH